MESNATHVDKSTEKVINQKDLNRMTWRSLFLQASFNYERMQAAGLLYGLIPGLKKIHKDKKDLSKSMSMHMEFFNTHPFLVTFIMGIVIAMEENKEYPDTIRAIKVATMGPLGGIGDALFWMTLLPISAGIGASMAMQGNIAGPFVFLAIFNIVHFALRFGLMNYGYNTGIKAMDTLKTSTESISRAASILGLTVVGGLIASFINLTTPIVIKTEGSEVVLQELLDVQVMPKLLPLAYALLMYRLLKKDLSPVMLIVITVIIGVVGYLIGII
ncbi:N-acetylgalactosamine-specific enzyme IID component of PTS [[Clostridium] ultunense Esp]|uniref:N-acetylgalactosamine-specific enzyme IID component of PTS n=1 Tax=[Clostridium] ultunense Esp TaxID=1288971 RepID=M1YZK2_9FIRM|nr:PTS system mannose/fructose/sorbose family transporter subunit IID [Schnuerera ultunensis]CCQ96030.1 N-acetylgalactosamine-specific enzyme IID component of PTS [[Clostridium] ultunense Esp]SHD76924.1 N-acetylgalactosamine-specific enzyme IID component of PTS [[Clostridium] ultunense Esp]